MQQAKVISNRRTHVDDFDEKDWLNFRQYKCEHFETHTVDSWKQILQRSLLYKKPHLVNAVDTRKDFYHSLFMIPAMFRVGRHEYVIRSPKEIYDRETHQFMQDEREPDYMYFSNVSDIRPEEIHPFVKISRSNKIVRLFDKEKSVFQPWRFLTPVAQ